MILEASVKKLFGINWKIFLPRGMRTFICSIILLYAWGSVAQGLTLSSSPSFSKQVTLGPILISYAEVDHLVANLKSQVESANAGTTKPLGLEAVLSVEGKEDTVSVAGWRALRGTPKLPEPGTRLVFEYFNPNAPIEKIGIRLNDYEREILVRGTDRAQVEAVYSYAKDTLSRSVQVWYVPSLRFVAKAAIIVLIPALFVFTLVESRWLLTYYSAHRLCIVRVALVAVFLAALLFPWEIFFPGFVVSLSPGNAWAAVFAILGILTTVATLLGLLYRVFRPDLESENLGAKRQGGRENL